MTIALVSTKRKFDRILDSLTNVSSTPVAAWDGAKVGSTSSFSSWNEPPTKRVRTSLSNSTHTAPTPRTTDQRAATQQETRTSSPRASMETMRELPNFMPGDRGQFLKRLETFASVTQWWTKPDRINEVQWAKRGWTLVGEGRVGCVGGCEKRLVIKLYPIGYSPTGEEDERRILHDSDFEEEFDEGLIDIYEGYIVNGHRETCLWRQRGCDDTIHRIQLSNPKTALAEFGARYESLAKISNELPSNISGPPRFDLRPALLLLAKALSTIIASEAAQPYIIPQNDANNRISAVYLAQFGWQADPNRPNTLVKCTHCFRRLGLWLWTRENPVKDSLDVLSEHRPYCPWVNGKVQGGRVRYRPGTASSSTSEARDQQAGWEVLRTTIENTIRYTKEEAELVIRSPPLKSASSLPSLTNATPSQASGSDNGAISSEELTLLEAARISPTEPARAESREERDQKDKERFSKLKFLRKIFSPKKKGKKQGKTDPKGKGKENSRPTTNNGESSTSGGQGPGAAPPGWI